jgi:acetolactate synthase-1/2/3 large subunit
MLAAERPEVYAGQGILWAGAGDALRALAERLPAPVLTTTNGKSAFSERHPLALGAAGYTGTAAAAAYLERADVVFAAGTSITRHNFSQPIPPGKRLVHLTSDERDLYKDYPATVGLLGDAALMLRQVIDALAARGHAAASAAGTSIAADIAGIKREWLESWQPRLTSDDVPISPYRVVWELMRFVDPAHTIVTHDSGNPRDQLLPFFEATAPRGYIGWGKSTQLGYGYGLALGAKLAAPEKLVVNVMGDAAFGMAGMDVETASRERIGVLTIILNNSALGGYEKAMPVATERYGTKFLTGSYAQVAAGLGAHSERVERPDDLPAALARARAATEGDRPAVVEVITREEPVFSKYW